MPSLPLRCDRCGTAVRGIELNRRGFTPCRSCGAPLEPYVFPAFFQEGPAGQMAAAITSEEDASCFFHPRKKAVATCSRCGRFLCGLCEVTIDAKPLCPSCLAPGGAAARKPLENQIVRHDRIAWMLAFWPLITLWFIWPVFLLTAGAALYLVVRYWREPRWAFIPRSRARMVAAALLALVQLMAVPALGWLYHKGGPAWVLTLVHV